MKPGTVSTFTSCFVSQKQSGSLDEQWGRRWRLNERPALAEVVPHAELRLRAQAAADRAAAVSGQARLYPPLLSLRPFITASLFPWPTLVLATDCGL